MGCIRFSSDKIGREAYKRHKEKYEAVLKKRYKELWWDPEDPQYSDYSKEVIFFHNEAVLKQLEDELWSSKL